MRFKGAYTNGEPDISLFTFFRSDMRKLVALGQYYPLMFQDFIKDPREYYNKRMEAEETLFFTCRVGKKVVGYTALDPIVLGQAYQHSWWKYGVRAKKDQILRVGKLAATYALEELGMARVSILIPCELKVNCKLVQLMGFEYEGTLRSFGIYDGERKDCNVYAIVR